MTQPDYVKSVTGKKGDFYVIVMTAKANFVSTRGASAICLGFYPSQKYAEEQSLIALRKVFPHHLVHFVAARKVGWIARILIQLFISSESEHEKVFYLDAIATLE